ncbi:MAG: hypothetical protein JJU29_21250 [Verrucomicrobia bacterium]|nr:hypothetical protein [Verrucomicrobiota bacterium]MCH8510819.1 hypothetical protein [Kiritimatiellia bacterium]
MKKMTQNLTLLVALVVALPLLPARAVVFQYALELEREHQRVFLWIPAEAEEIKGILVAGTTSIEKDLVRDPRVREVCNEKSIAILFGTPGLHGFFNQELLDQFAEKSGYAELSTAPLFFVGHSAGGPQAKDLAKQYADRTFGLMLSRGGIPDPEPGTFPTLVLTGQFDEFGGLMRDEDGREPAWENPKDALARNRAANPDLVVTYAVEPGAGHFGWSDRNSKLFSLFLAKAATPPPSSERVATPLNAREEGEGDTSDPANALHLDRELAEAVHAYHADLRANKQDQFLRWDNRFWVDAGVRFFFHNLDFEGDGRTFRVNPVFAERVPGQHNNNGPRWLNAGEEVGNSGGPIRLRVVSGPAVVVGEDLLRLEHDALNPAIGPWGRLTFLAYTPGDDTYRHAETPGMAPRGYRGPGGSGQTITFEELSDLTVGSDPVELQATASSELPVDFYVARGPAVVRDGKLHLAEIPARATFPIEIEVVAYQPGSGMEPRFSPAPGVSQTFQLTQD